MKKITFYIISFLISLNAVAQSTKFIVYSVKGKPILVSTSQPLITGTKINETDIIKINTNDVVILVCENYKTVKIYNEGLFKVSTLVKLCSKQTNDLTTSYFKYIWEEFTHPHSNPEENHKKFMKTTGAVSRGCNDSTIIPSIDSICLIQNKMYLFRWSFLWVVDDEEPELKIKVFDDRNYGRTLIDSTVQWGDVNVTNVLNRLPSGDYFWLLTNNPTKPCDRNYVGIYSQQEFDTIFNEIKKKVVAVDDASEKFMIGYLLEQQNFLLEACSYYEQAIKLSPKNEMYSNRLKVFKKTFFNQ